MTTRSGAAPAGSSRAIAPRWQALFAALAVLLGTLASGTLECEPLRETREIAHGREIYGRMCAVCHGADGEGYKADQAPALAQAAFLSSVTDSFLTSAITHGRVGSTMSAWGLEHGGPLVASDVRAVVGFLRSWQKDGPARLDERPIEGDVGRGTALFTANCARCHGAQGTGGLYENVGNPQLLSTASNGFLRLAVQQGRAGTLMPAFQGTLHDQGVEDVLAFLRTGHAITPPRANAYVPPAKPPPLPLGPVPLNPRGPDPVGFDSKTGFTRGDVVASELHRGARMAILDARAPSDYTGEHIAGAVSVPFYDPDPYVGALPRDSWLVCYCGCPHAESGQLATKLRAKGFTKVTVIDEGLRYWQSKKYGTHQGTLP